MIARGAAIVLASLLVCSCGEPKVQCTYDGHIVIPPGTDSELAAKWKQQNDALDLRRFDVSIGRLERSSMPAGSLDKAVGCP